MKNKNKLVSILHFVAAVCYFLAAAIGKNYTFIPLGCCFMILGIVTGRSKQNSKEKDDS